ncbi:LysR family transcriptional regulator [Rhodobacteraceae bacterium NNCM2]|nr:LysR family transcriptional regulator [Coraliihabitans acroporae]
MLNAQWLETFVTLCDIGHFTRAASALNMTQPGVSQHVRKLEQQVGAPLLSRDGKSFTPTPAGEAVLAIGRRRRIEERDLREALRFDDPDRGAVGVACSGSLALLLYPRFMEVMATAPGLTLRLEARPQTGVVEGVASGAADFGIVNHAPTHARLEGERLGHDELCLLLPQDSPPPETLADLDVLGFIAHPDGFAYADELLGANFGAEYPGAQHLRQRSFINQIGQIPEPVARGLGYTILPRSGLGDDPVRGRVRIAPLPRPVRHELWLIRRKGRILPARCGKVRKLIEEALRAL